MNKSTIELAKLASKKAPLVTSRSNTKSTQRSKKQRLNKLSKQK